MSMRTRAFVIGLAASLLGGVGARAETLPIWWADAVAPPAIEALEAAFESALPNPITLNGPRGATLSVTHCDAAADAASRHFTTTNTVAQQHVLRCTAIAHVLFAAEAGQSTFRAPNTKYKGRVVPGGAPKPLTLADVHVLPALLAPYEGCGFGVLALRAADQFWSLARFAHVYGAGQEDDGREGDTLNGEGAKALTVQASDAGLTIKQNGVTATLALLALGDFDSDGTEDALVQKNSGQTARLYMLSQFRAGAVMRVKNLGASYEDLAETCPDLMLELAKSSLEVKG